MKELNLSELSKLVKNLRENGVTEFEGLGIKLRLVTDGPTIATSANPPARPTKATAKRAEAIEERALIQDNADLVDAELDQLLIENPAEYERLLRERELGDVQKDRRAESDIQ